MDAATWAVRDTQPSAVWHHTGPGAATRGAHSHYALSSRRIGAGIYTGDGTTCARTRVVIAILGGVVDITPAKVCGLFSRGHVWLLHREEGY